MTYALKTARAKFLMTVPSSMDVAIPAAKNAGIPAERIFLLEGSKAGYTSVQQLVEKGKSLGAARQVVPWNEQLLVEQLSQPLSALEVVMFVHALKRLDAGM